MLKLRNLIYLLPLTLATSGAQQIHGQKLPPVQETASLSVEQCAPANLNIQFRRGGKVTNLQCRQPLMIAEIPAGNYEIAFSYADYETLVMKIDLTPGESRKIESVKLTKKKK